MPRAAVVVAPVRVGSLVVCRVVLVAAEQVRPPVDLEAQELLAKDLRVVVPRGVAKVAVVAVVVALVELV